MSEVRPRWWPTWLIAAVATAILVLVWSGEAEGQSKVMQTMAVALLTSLSLLAWSLLLSRFPWRRRLRIVGGFLVIVGLIVATVRVGGVDGDLAPILEWRWSRAAQTPDVGPALKGVVDQPVVASESDFPQFLGPHRDGAVTGQLDPDWDLHPPRELWRESIGPGWSGFAVVGDLAVTMAQRGPSEVILAYELTTGEPRWTFDYPALYETTIGGAGPRTVPTIESGQVFAFGGTGVLTALDLASGALRWQRDVVAEHGGNVPDWGKTGAPLIVDDQVVVSAGGPEGHSLV
ncbi:MAG: PQQ-like beta-propeller repeat protein, partial [Thermoanaerobaculia bacterium]|nr:PQQ-like beta-propeller repeat protein [Thermoanaerobaculia bacterium]